MAEGRAHAILESQSPENLQEIQLIAQGVRAALDPKFKVLTHDAAEQSKNDVERAAQDIAKAEASAGAAYTSERLPEKLVERVVDNIRADHQKEAKAGRSAA